MHAVRVVASEGMLIAEAQWLGGRLLDLPTDAFPLANLGSGTAAYRSGRSPWTEQYVFAPLAEAGREVVHVDVKRGDGVDLVADLLTEDGCSAVARCGARTLLCTNLLEHVPQPATALRSITRMCPTGGYLVITGPKRFPYHADPIDNGFRPSWAAVATMLDGEVEVIDGADVPCRRMAFYYARSRRRLPLLIGRLALPVYRPAEWARVASWTGRRAVAFCLVARRLAADQGSSPPASG